MSRGWIGVDLDGTLAKMDKSYSDGKIGTPIPAMMARVKKWISEGKKVKIFTARVANGQAAIGPIREWCRQNVGQELPITNKKDPEMIQLWDDRAVGVERNTGKILSGDA